MQHFNIFQPKVERKSLADTPERNQVCYNYFLIPFRTNFRALKNLFAREI